MILRAKFTCTHIDDYGTWKLVHLQCLYSNNKEDNQFSAATPSGDMKMTVSSEAGMTYFKPGGKYYLDFNEVVE